ncbi:MAG: glycosyltransferase family 9 protein [Deltaproteobacteria bacterium]|nr:glycosyltransferase family 9 protein [Deltaproteobacteria bacterium]
MRILIVKVSSLGDVIHTLPVLYPLREHYPEAHISWLVEQEAAELILDHPLIDRVLIFPKTRWLRGLKNHRHLRLTISEAVTFIKNLRTNSYDLVLDFQGLLKTGILISMCRGIRKRGFAPTKEKSHIFLNETVPRPSFPLHAVDRYLQLVTTLGCSCKAPRFFIPIRQIHRDSVGAFFESRGMSIDRPLVILHPAARWKSKLWEESKWAQLGDLLVRDGVQVIFTGSQDDAPLIRNISRRMKYPGIDTAGLWDLRELAFLFSRADIVVVPDSGCMHLAAAVGTPVVALFGPTDPALTGPYGDGHTVIAKPVDCRPCFKRTCVSNRCMTDISAEEVWGKSKPYLCASTNLFSMREDCHGIK